VIDNLEASILMTRLAPHKRERLIAEAGGKVIDLRAVFAREQAQNRRRA